MTFNIGKLMFDMTPKLIDRLDDKSLCKLVRMDRNIEMSALTIVNIPY